MLYYVVFEAGNVIWRSFRKGENYFMRILKTFHCKQDDVKVRKFEEIRCRTSMSNTLKLLFDVLNRLQFYSSAVFNFNL